jgi:class 3 adenylate cyclase/tetratricopeptide (TPR) repeat protein
MQCPFCRAESADHATFCGRCGARLEVSCRHCRQKNPVENAYCFACGADLSPPAASERMIADLPDDERKEVSVLFADVSGSLSLIAKRDPETADAMLSEIIDLMTAVVHRFGGTVNKIVGDGVMALFGAPVTLEDHAVRAACAAVAMRETNYDGARPTSDTSQVPIRIRVGISSGEAVVRKMSTDVSVLYDAVGEIVHLAARMQQTAEPGTVRITAATNWLLAGIAETRSLGAVAIKGMPEPIELFELQRLTNMVPSVRPAERRGLTRFVNRELELNGLEQALTEVANGEGQVVALVGEAGVGKSRSLAQFIGSIDQTAWTIVEAGSYSYEKLTSHLPFVRLFERLVGISDREPREDVRAKVAEMLARLGANLDFAPAIGTLLEIEQQDRSWHQLDPHERKQRLSDAICAVLLLTSQIKPLVVILEDLQWIDSETQNVIDQLVETLPRAQIMLIVTYRPEYRHDWGGHSHYRQFRLAPLGKAHASLLLESLVGSDSQVEPLRQMLLEQTEAYPFFLEERVYSLVDDRALVGTRGDYQLVGPLETLKVPSTVKAVLAARIDRLRPVEKRVLQAASVIGEKVPMSTLRMVDNLSDAELEAAIRSLQKGEFLYQTEVLPEVIYSFRHTLTHDVAYGSLLRERKAALHARVVAAIEAQHGSRSLEFSERLARHAREGRVWDKATYYARSAGIRAASRSANYEAVAFFEQALSNLEALPKDAANQALAIDIRLDMRNSLFPLGRLQALVEVLNQARATAEAIGDRSRLSRVLMYLSHACWLLGRQNEALVEGERALELAIAEGDGERVARTKFHLGLSHAALGQFRPAIRVMQDTVTYCERVALTGPIGPLASMALGYMSRCLAELGDFAEALAIARKSIEIAEAGGRPMAAIIAYSSAGQVLERMGDVAEAVPLLERGLELARSAEARLMVPVAAGLLGAAYARAGRINDAFSLLREAVETAAQIRLMLQQPTRLARLGRAHFMADDNAAAGHFADRAAALATVQEDPAAHAEALLLKGDVLASAETLDAERIRSLYDLAAQIAAQLEMRPLAAHCRAALGKLEARAGNQDAADRERQLAGAIYSELGMRRTEG